MTNSVSCPRCGYSDNKPERLFSDGGDDDQKNTCNHCGQVYIVLKRIITVEYSVKD